MYQIIVNPASKTGKGRTIWNLMQTELDNLAIPYQVHFTTGVGSATKIVYSLTHFLQEPMILIILGGDGTINEVIQGICNHKLVTIGYVPTGSSNDLARDISIETDPIKRLHTILNPNTIKEFNIGRVTYEDETFRLFCVGCGIGFDAAVCEEALHSKMKDFLNKVKLGKLTYLGIALKQIITAPRVSLTLALDDQDPIHLDQFLFVATMIHRYEGGGFMFCPSADAYDNIFNLCVLGNMPIYKILLCLPTAFKGKHFKYRDVNPYEAKEIIIETSKPLWVHTDGEVKRKATKIKITNEKEFIKFIC